MKPAPLEPARLVFAEGEPPSSSVYGDRYHPRMGALAQAHHVFLAGNGLPGRWQGREVFTLLETGFGLGLNFLATWAAWRADPARPRQLHWVSVERHPVRPEDLARALAQALAAADRSSQGEAALSAELQKAWPPAARGLHRLSFEGGRVLLTLGLGDAQELLPQLRLQADALVLDGFAPGRNPTLWSPPIFKALARLAAPGCTAATWSVARPVREGLAAAGFELRRAPGLGGKREITTAVHAPRGRPRGLVPMAAPGLEADRRALVVGGGLAGAAVARALARDGVDVRVFDAAPAPAAGASGNPAGLFHATVSADDSPYARLFRAAALHAARVYREALAQGVPGAVQGLVRLASEGQDAAAMQALLSGQGLPPEVAQALPRDAAGRCAGLPVPGDAWFYPWGGWLDPGAWVRAVLQGSANPGPGRITWHGGQPVAALRREAPGWTLLDAAGQTLARAPLLVLANAEGAARLWPAAGWALGRRRGQITWWNERGPGSAEAALARPLAGDGYALPLHTGPHRQLLCGATRQDGDDDPAVREADHRANLARLVRLTGLEPPADPSAWQGRVGWRVHTDDRLPLAGAVPADAAGLPAHRLTQARHWPREPGLYVLAALGARGLSLAPLLGELVAAQALGRPWPLEQALADAVDPARWRVRAARVAGSSRPARACRDLPDAGSG